MYARLLLQLSLCLLLPASFAVAETASPVPAPAGQPALVVVLPAAAAPGLLVPSPAAVPVPVKSLTLEELNRKRLQRLQDVARDARQQRDSMAEFDNYLNWMGGALAGYAKYVEAGSFAAGFAKYLPVPYAGQAGQLTKFISHFALSLSATSAAVKSYLASSGYFIAGVDAIGTAAGRDHELASLTFYADQQLSRDMSELQTRLATTSELSGSALSFLLGLQQYLGSSDEYWQKTKSLLGRKEADKGEKGAVAASVDGLRTKAQAFNGRLKQYDETVNKTTLRIASLVAYDELRQDIEAKAGDVAVAAHDNK